MRKTLGIGAVIQIKICGFADDGWYGHLLDCPHKKQSRRFVSAFIFERCFIPVWQCSQRERAHAHPEFHLARRRPPSRFHRSPLPTHPKASINPHLGGLTKEGRSFPKRPAFHISGANCSTGTSGAALIHEQNCEKDTSFRLPAVMVLAGYVRS